jgi:hypothetical protein
MNAKKKHLSIKAQIRAEKERERKIATALFVVLMFSLVMLSVYFSYQIFLSPSPEENFPEPTLRFTPKKPSSGLRAIIVDQLSLTMPNETFFRRAAEILVDAGYTVDYYSGEKVTVAFFKNLPLDDYKIMILRIHSSAMGPHQEEVAVRFFTSERFSKTKYVQEQLTDQVGWMAYSGQDYVKGILYFGIGPKFVAQSMKGTCKDALVIMMGCEGLNNTKMAQAFVEKGAKAYISWKGSVSASHTDTATINLLQHIITEKQTINQAVENTMKEAGPDPIYKSLLTYYPLEAGEQTIEGTLK